MYRLSQVNKPYRKKLDTFPFIFTTSFCLQMHKSDTLNKLSLAIMDLNFAAPQSEEHK